MTSQNNPQSFFVCPNLILMKNSKVLLLRRMDWAPLWPSYWHCVTGKMEQGETPKQTIIREAFEEVGLDIYPTTYNLTIEHVFETAPQCYHQLYV